MKKPDTMHRTASSHSRHLNPTPQLNSEARLMQQLQDRNLQDSYAFIIQFSDKEKTVFFPKKEVEILAREIGIDIDRDKSQHIWFLQQALLSDLPFGWTKEQDFEGNAVYHNYLNHTASHTHPNIHKFRVAFNEILKSEHFKENLCDLGAKTMSEYEKIYLQGKINSLPLEERKALTKKLKAIINKDEVKASGELTKRIIKWLRGKNGKLGIKDNLNVVHDGKSMLRFKAIVEAMEDRKKDELLKVTESVEALEHALSIAESWYEKWILDTAFTCPEEVENLESYQYADIDEVLRNATNLGINPQEEPFLLWIARMFTSLPLPPFWRKTHSHYYSMEFDVVSLNHPGERFFNTFTKRIRKVVTNSCNKSSFLNFYDALMRENTDNYNDDASLFAPFIKSKYFSVAEKTILYNKPKEHQVTTVKETPAIVTDIEILEVAKECSLDLNKESHLLKAIEEILTELKVQLKEIWELRVPQDGAPYWFSEESKISLKEYPYLDQIKDELEEVRKKLIKPRVAKKQMQKQIRQEAKRFVREIILHQNTQGKQPKYNFKRLSEIIGKELSKEEALDLLFACPFELVPKTRNFEPKLIQRANSSKNVGEVVSSHRKIYNRITSLGRGLSMKRRLVSTPQGSSDGSIGVNIFSVGDGGKVVEKKITINQKEVESRLKRKRLVEGIQKRELEKIRQRKKLLRRPQSRQHTPVKVENTQVKRKTTPPSISKKLVPENDFHKNTREEADQNQTPLVKRSVLSVVKETVEPVSPVKGEKDIYPSMFITAEQPEVVPVSKQGKVENETKPCIKTPLINEKKVSVEVKLPQHAYTKVQPQKPIAKVETMNKERVKREITPQKIPRAILQPEVKEKPPIEKIQIKEKVQVKDDITKSPIVEKPPKKVDVLANQQVAPAKARNLALQSNTESPKPYTENVPTRILTHKKMLQKAAIAKSNISKARENKQIQTVPLEDFESILKSILSKKDGNPVIEFVDPNKVPSLCKPKNELLYGEEGKKGTWNPTSKSNDPLLSPVEVSAPLKISGTPAKQHNQWEKRICNNLEPMTEPVSIRYPSPIHSRMSSYISDLDKSKPSDKTMRDTRTNIERRTIVFRKYKLQSDPNTPTKNSFTKIAYPQTEKARGIITPFKKLIALKSTKSSVGNIAKVYRQRPKIKVLLESPAQPFSQNESRFDSVLRKSKLGFENSSPAPTSQKYSYQHFMHYAKHVPPFISLKPTSKPLMRSAIKMVKRFKMDLRPNMLMIMYAILCAPLPENYSDEGIAELAVGKHPADLYMVYACGMSNATLAELAKSPDLHKEFSEACKLMREYKVKECMETKMEKTDWTQINAQCVSVASKLAKGLSTQVQTSRNHSLREYLKSQRSEKGSCNRRKSGSLARLLPIIQRKRMSVGGKSEG